MPRTVRGRLGGSRASGSVLEAPRRSGAGRRGSGKTVRLKRRAVAGLRPGSIEERLLTEEERIESAKYQPRELPARLFEEERFLFPDSYGINRLRLMVKDPYWLFAYWDVDPRLVKDLRKELGARVAALARLTLRIGDPDHGGATSILLPEDARGWYVQADAQKRAYEAELGLTLPSGEFRALARSNRVSPPQAGPSAVKASRRASYKPAQPEVPAAPGAGAPAASAASAASGTGPGPWLAPPPSEGGAVPANTETRPARENRGGASDAFRR